MISFWGRILLTAVLPLIVWFAYGQPALNLMGNAALCGFALALLLGMMWHDVVAKAFNGDLFTYRLVSISLNAIFGVAGLILAGVLFYQSPSGYGTPGDVPGLVWAGLLVLLLLSWIIPLFTSTKVSALPEKSSRRQFEDPSKS